MAFIDIDTSLLRSNNVYLELLQPDHIPILKTLAEDARLWEYTKTLLINDTYNQQFQKYSSAALDDLNTGGQCSFVIRNAATASIIGMTRYYKIEPPHKRLSIGFTWYIPEVWGQVYNKECKLLLLQYAFETLGYQRVEFEVAHKNIRSQKAVEKIGGIKEGVLRKHGLQGDGTVRNTVVFSIIDDEWVEKKKKLVRMVQAASEV